jgi:cardiolipin synthase
LIAKLAARLSCVEGPARTEAFANALERNELTPTATAKTLRDRLGVPHHRLEPYRAFLPVLREESTSVVVVALRAAAETVREDRTGAPRVEVAWTYPGDARPGLRTTGGVARDVISGATSELLIVGYSVTVDSERAGLAARTIGAISAAASRGVQVTAVLHRDPARNREALLFGWPGGRAAPSVFTWPEQADEMAALHAKLLVADRNDALVTSANLTYHGFEGNIEMGLRVSGVPASQIRDRFHDLIGAGALVPWSN